MGREFMWKTGVAEDDAVGKEGLKEVFEFLLGVPYLW